MYILKKKKIVLNNILLCADILLRLLKENFKNICNLINKKY